MAGYDHSGYPMKWFKDQNTARRFFECAICLEVLKDAVQVRDCGHQFCALCIDDILKANPRSASCPSCRIEISDVLMVFEDHAARRMINQLEVNCCNEGCTWTGCLSSLLQNHQNNCNFLIHRDDNNAQKLKLKELEQKHDTLMLDVFLFKEKHEQDITDLKLKHEQDIKEQKLKHEEDIKELKRKHEKDIGDLQMKHEQEKQELRDLQMKHEQERQVIREIQLKQQQEKQLQLMHEQNLGELKLKLQQTEDLLRRMRNEEKDLCGKEIPQKFSPVVGEKVNPVEIIPVQSDQPLEEDLCWEDKEEKISGRFIVKEEYKDADTEAPAAAQTRIKYERDFLLQLRYMPVCCEKPAGLPKIEIVLDGPVQPGEGGGSQRQKSQGGVKQRGSRKTLSTVVLDSWNPWPQPEEREKYLTKEEKKSVNLKFFAGENDDELLKLLSADQFKNDTVFAFIEKNFKEKKRKEGKFINHLVTAVAESCIINKDQEAGPDCYKDKLKARKDILRKYLDNNIDLELEALFTLQEIYVKYNKPAGMLSQFFSTLYDEEVLTKEAFMKWKQDESPSRQEAKGPALQSTALFFKLLQDATVENVMMQGQRQGSFILGHPMAMVPRQVRGRVYSSSPQGHSPMQGYIPQQNMQYEVVRQDPHGQPVMRPGYIPNVKPAYQVQATSAPFQPQYIQQQQQYFNQGIPQPVYYTMPNNQLQPSSAQTASSLISTTNTNKPKPKRSSKIRIRDPKDHKDVTDEILSNHNNTANGRPAGTLH